MTPILWLLICSSAVLCAADPHAWNWQCDPVEHLATVDVDKLVGNWYMVKHFHEGENANFLCTVVEVHRSNDTSKLDVTFHFGPNSGRNGTQHFTYDLASSSQWLDGDYHMQVVHQAEDGNTIASVGCSNSVAHPGTKVVAAVILTKSPTSDVSTIVSQLHTLGVAGTDGSSGSVVCPTA